MTLDSLLFSVWYPAGKCHEGPRRAWAELICDRQNTHHAQRLLDEAQEAAVSRLLTRTGDIIWQLSARSSPSLSLATKCARCLIAVTAHVLMSDMAVAKCSLYWIPSKETLCVCYLYTPAKSCLHICYTNIHHHHLHQHHCHYCHHHQTIPAPPQPPTSQSCRAH